MVILSLKFDLFNRIYIPVKTPIPSQSNLAPRHLQILDHINFFLLREFPRHPNNSMKQTSLQVVKEPFSDASNGEVEEELYNLFQML